MWIVLCAPGFQPALLAGFQAPLLAGFQAVLRAGFLAVLRAASSFFAIVNVRRISFLSFIIAAAEFSEMQNRNSINIRVNSGIH